MSNPRSKGLALLLLGALLLGGNTLDILPREAFWAGLLTYPFGAYLFLKGTRRAREQAERRIARKLTPRLGNAAGQEHARRQARHVVRPHASGSAGEAASQEDVQGLRRQPEFLGPGNRNRFRVTPDVSYPSPQRDPGRLADQLEKLAKLRQEGILSREELAIAKAKLLG